MAGVDSKVIPFLMHQSEVDELKARVVQLEQELTQNKIRTVLNDSSLGDRELEAIIEQMPVGVAIAEAPSGKMLLHNSEAVRLLAHPMVETETFTGYVKYGALHPDGTPYRSEEYPMARALWGETIHHHEMLYRRGDGQLTWFSLSAVPIFNQKGEIVRTVGTFYDIGARKFEEEKQRQIDQNSSRLNELKERFLALVVHDLRSPLSVIKGYADVLQHRLLKNQLDATNRETATIALAVRGIERQSDRMEELINTLMDYSQIENAQFSIVTRRHPVSDLLELVAETIERHKVSLKTHEIAGQLPELAEIGQNCTANYDSHRLEQVLDNLILNAVKYSPEDTKIEMNAKLQPSAAKPTQIILCVQDQGYGISVADQPYLFEKFYRSASANALNVKGLGLGLYISAEIVRQHGGQIWVESEPGKGSTFYVALPLVANS
jgi:two-component system, OmpR family, phosphate regulon sensor histidine kinase PhoR